MHINSDLSAHIHMLFLSIIFTVYFPSLAFFFGHLFWISFSLLFFLSLPTPFSLGNSLPKSLSLFTHMYVICMKYRRILQFLSLSSSFSAFGLLFTILLRIFSWNTPSPIGGKAIEMAFISLWGALLWDTFSNNST